jgi:hypothetical protein
MVVTTFLFSHTTFLWATCCLICFIPIVKPFLTHWSWLRVVPFIERGNRPHGGCDRSAGDVYSSMVPDPTTIIFRGPCTPILWFVFPVRVMRLITDRYFCNFIFVIFMFTVNTIKHEDFHFAIILILTLQSSIFLFYVVIYHFYPLMVCTYPS